MASATKGNNVALKLYRNILRAHKQHLPSMEMRQLGDTYVKSEFKQHKAVTNETQLQQFFTAWNEYLDHITQAGRRKDIESVNSSSSSSSSSAKAEGGKPGFGQNLPLDVELTEEQVAQLEKLKEETSKATK